MEPQSEQNFTCIVAFSLIEISARAVWRAVEKKKSNASIKLWQLLLATAQLVLIVLVLCRFELEPTIITPPWPGSDPSVGLGNEVLGKIPLLFAIVPLFILHSLIPLRLRRPLLLIVVAALFYFLFGATTAVYLIACGLGLIGLCHVPIKFRWRVLMVVVVGVLLASIQMVVGEDGKRLIDGGRYLNLAVPVLGAIFMFRLMIYLYDVAHEKPGTKTSWVDRVSYFFLLPVPLFPFFPTLDYKVHLRCYYARPSFETYQVGLLWIARGVGHLLLYRLIHHFYSPSADMVHDLGGVIAFCLSGYLIYLRVSGVFHIIGGLMRLFGHDLPETHRLYFFASGFSDYWLRINIYWKDFMAKLFFFPTFAWLRRTGWGQTAKVAAATAVVFMVTTILHSYQSFWLRGEFIIHETDYWFWGILGGLVILNNWWRDKRRGKGGVPVATVGFDLKQAAVLSARVVGMFVFLCVLWALWNGQTMEKFLGVMAQVTDVKPRQALGLAAFCVGGVVLGTAGQWLAANGFKIFDERPGLVRSIVSVVVPLSLLTTAWSYHKKYGIPGEIGAKFDAIHLNLPSANDQMMRERSYYQGLFAGVKSVGAEEEQNVKDLTGDIRFIYYKERFVERDMWGAPWSTNRWRMRDKDTYSKKKPSGAYRIALGGASYVMGRGVGNGENFESLLEDHLNANGVKVEILNFGMSANCVLQRVADLELRMADFDPDLFLMVCHPNETKRNLLRIAEVVADGRADLTYPFLKDIVKDAGVARGDDETDVVRALTPYAEEIMRKAYSRLAEVCKEKGIKPVWVYLPMTASAEQKTLSEEGRAYAEEAGIETLVLEDVYGGLGLVELRVSKDDNHPNQRGHRFVAKALLRAMKSKRKEIGLPAGIDSVPLPEAR